MLPRLPSPLALPALALLLVFGCAEDAASEPSSDPSGDEGAPGITLQGAWGIADGGCDCRDASQPRAQTIELSLRASPSATYRVQVTAARLAVGNAENLSLSEEELMAEARVATALPGSVEVEQAASEGDTVTIDMTAAARTLGLPPLWEVFEPMRWFVTIDVEGPDGRQTFEVDTGWFDARPGVVE
ncbi:MAG: hypothetical protein R3F60_33315 [bacterium]